MRLTILLISFCNGTSFTHWCLLHLSNNWITCITSSLQKYVKIMSMTMSIFLFSIYANIWDTWNVPSGQDSKSNYIISYNSMRAFRLGNSHAKLCWSFCIRWRARYHFCSLLDYLVWEPETKTIGIMNTEKIHQK